MYTIPDLKNNADKNQENTLKLNLGCGVNKIDGYLNVDKYGSPDLKLDLEITPWEFKDDSIDEIMLNHVLEHLGARVDVFFSILKEIYRICKNGSLIYINVPHPRHDNFINDPTHVRIITPELLGLFSKKNCAHWKEIRAANSPLADYLDIDFELQSTSITLEKEYLEALQSKKMGNAELELLLKTRNNIASEYRMVVKVIKNPRT